MKVVSAKKEVLEILPMPFYLKVVALKFFQQRQMEEIYLRLLLI